MMPDGKKEKKERRKKEERKKETKLVTDGQKEQNK